jgi:hypothetical protein
MVDRRQARSMRLRCRRTSDATGAPDDACEDPYDALNRMLLRRINESVQAFLSHTVLQGSFTLRLAVGNLRTTDMRLQDTLALIDSTLAAIRDQHTVAESR